MSDASRGEVSEGRRGELAAASTADDLFASRIQEARREGGNTCQRVGAFGRGFVRAGEINNFAREKREIYSKHHEPSSHHNR